MISWKNVNLWHVYLLDRNSFFCCKGDDFFLICISISLKSDGFIGIEFVTLFKQS